jgi:carbonic anhydrase
MSSSRHVRVFPIRPVSIQRHGLTTSKGGMPGAAYLGQGFAFAARGGRAFAGGKPALLRGAAGGLGAHLFRRAGRTPATPLRYRARTPVEILFDQGFGDLFVVRIAGNVVAPSVVGSIEFAASQFGTRLVVVLGHTRCGAIAATASAVRTGNGPESKNIRSVTDRIAPHIAPVIRDRPDAPDPALMRELMRINVRASADHLRHGSRILEDLVLAGRVAVVVADYELETGRVTFFDEPPEASP